MDCRVCADLGRWQAAWLPAGSWGSRGRGFFPPSRPGGTRSSESVWQRTCRRPYVADAQGDRVTLAALNRVRTGGVGRGPWSAAGWGSTSASRQWPSTTGCAAWQRDTSTSRTRSGRSSGASSPASSTAYPFRITVICEQLGVPHEDEPPFHSWARLHRDPARPAPRAGGRADLEMDEYMSGLIERFRTAPGPGVLSRWPPRKGWRPRTWWPRGGCCRSPGTIVHARSVGE